MLRLRRLAPALLLPLLLPPPAPLHAQTADDPNEGLRLVPDPATPGNYEIRLWGRSGRTYFLLHNDDLTKPWTYFPMVETGHDAVISYGFSNPAPAVFVNLRYLDQALADPFGMDSDGDGLTNQQEFDLRTDLFSTDTDHDGLPDAWEVAHGLDPRDPSDALADPNGNGVSNLDEYRNGNDPHLLAYDGLKPVIQIVSGNNQRPVAGQFMSQPMKVRVFRPDGTTPWGGVPVHFHSDPGEGLLATSGSSDAPLLPVLTVATDANGYASAWLKCP